MARNDFDSWVPEEYGSDVIQRVNLLSAVEANSRRIPMATDTRNEPRSAGVGVASVAKGGTYAEDTSTNDEVVLVARKFGQAIRIAEEDLNDSNVNIVASKQSDWATSYSKFLDNAVLGTTAVANGTTVPFESVFVTASTVTYTTAATGITYDNLSASLGALEEGDYFDLNSTVVIAHPSVRASLRGIKDTQDNPIFVQGLSGTPDTIFGINVSWSLGAKSSATATDSPTGQALVVFVNSDYLMLGVRSGPESMLSDEAGYLTDEPILKMRARRAFALGAPGAASVLSVGDEPV